MNGDEASLKLRRKITLTVNGKRVNAEIDPRMTLAEFLREELDLTGTKVGCNRGECGSCTVLLDGQSVYSCTLLAVDAADRAVQTVEGLTDENGELHPLQKAFIEEDALQCGYCTPGMLMAVKALIDRNPRPSAGDVKQAIDGNFCRCGCYPNIVNATLHASERMARKERID
jgi:aerobic-type carbon monoxide dehydrogenase small subunit (CoxS/CutS family)